MTLIRGGDSDVVGALSRNFGDLLPILYAGAVEMENGNPSLVPPSYPIPPSLFTRPTIDL